MNVEIFKQCTVCGLVWRTRKQFLDDPELTLVGYQANFKKLTAGLFLFNHGCRGATLAIKASVFRDLYQGPVFDQRLTEGPSCPGHCLHQDDLQPCPEMCECSYVRHILQVIAAWPKKEAVPSTRG